ncbi:MAG: helix-turn-helix domain-containing protein [Opitutales bacterium]
MPKFVALAYDANLNQANAIYRGVAEYIAAAKLDWQIIPLSYAFESQLIELACSGCLDGAIGSFISDGWVRSLTDQGVHAVNLFHLSRIESLPCVGVDDRAMGRTAGHHLLENGARSLLYFSRGRSHQNQLREQGIQEVCPPGVDFLKRPPSALMPELEAILRLPRPMGIFCSSDRRAREMIQALTGAGLEVGKDALVVGVGDEAGESLFAGVEISSFQLPATTVGRAASELLARQFAHPTELLPTTEIQIEARLLARASSLPTPQARLATRASRLAEEELENSVFDIGFMARRLGVSRRTLELATREELGESPYQMLSRLRFERARHLLEQGQLSIGEVGCRCGYPGVHHFSAWFRQRCGLAPSFYRQRHRKAPAAHLDEPGRVASLPGR